MAYILTQMVLDAGGRVTRTAAKIAQTFYLLYDNQ